MMVIIFLQHQVYNIPIFKYQIYTMSLFPRLFQFKNSIISEIVFPKYYIT